MSWVQTAFLDFFFKQAHDKSLSKLKVAEVNIQIEFNIEQRILSKKDGVFLIWSQA